MWLLGGLGFVTSASSGNKNGILLRRVRLRGGIGNVWAREAIEA